MINAYKQREIRDGIKVIWINLELPKTEPQCASIQGRKVLPEVNTARLAPKIRVRVHLITGDLTLRTRPPQRENTLAIEDCIARLYC